MSKSDRSEEKKQYMSIANDPAHPFTEPTHLASKDDDEVAQVLIGEIYPESQTYNGKKFSSIIKKTKGGELSHIRNGDCFSSVADFKEKLTQFLLTEISSSKLQEQLYQLIIRQCQHNSVRGTIIAFIGGIFDTQIDLTEKMNFEESELDISIKDNSIVLAQTIRLFSREESDKTYARISSTFNISLADINHPNHENYQATCIDLSYELTPRLDNDPDFIAVKFNLDKIISKIDERNHIVDTSNKFSTFKENYKGSNKKLINKIEKLINTAYTKYLDDPIIFNLEKSLLKPLRVLQSAQIFNDPRLMFFNRSTIAEFLNDALAKITSEEKTSTPSFGSK